MKESFTNSSSTSFMDIMDIITRAITITIIITTIITLTSMDLALVGLVGLGGKGVIGVGTEAMGDMMGIRGEWAGWEEVGGERGIIIVLMIGEEDPARGCGDTGTE